MWRKRGAASEAPRHNEWANGTGDASTDFSVSMATPVVQACSLTLSYVLGRTIEFLVQAQLPHFCGLFAEMDAIRGGGE